MAINFPTSLDSFDNVTNDTDVRNTHPTLHNDINDAVEKLQEKVGIDNSADTSSLDYKVTNLDTTKFDTADFDTYFDTALATKDTGDLSEGINLYYTQARFDTAFGLKDTGDLTEGINLYYTEDRFDTRLATKDTDDLSEGLSNLYYTETRVSNNIDVNANTGARHNAVTVTDSSEIDFTLAGQDITASLKTGSIDESKLDTSVNASLDLADSSLQSGDNISLLNNNTGYITNISTFDTGDLTEGTNLYYTEARVTANTSVTDNTTHRGLTNNPHSVTMAQVTNTTTKGDLITHSTEVTRLPIGSDNQFLIADSSEDVGMAWTDPQAVMIGYSTTTSGLTATDVQGAIDEVEGRLDTAEGDIDDLEALDGVTVSKLYQPDGTNAFVYTDNGGNLHIDGEITQGGEIWETHAQQLYTTNDFIKTRDGAIAGLGAGEISGMEVLLYDGANNLIFGTDSDGYFKVGETGDLQILATREDTPEDGGVAFWDDTNKRFDTDTGFIWDDTNKSLDIAGAVKIAGKLTGLSNGTANSDAVNFSQLNTKLNTSDFGTSFDTAFSGKSTSNLTEGTNLYYTEARVSANTTVAGNVSAITALQAIDGVKVSKLFQPNGTNPLIGVDNNGNVGIGKSYPSHKLDVAGDLNIANNKWFSALDYAGTGVVNMFKVNEDNEIDVGGTLNIGTLSLSEDSGAVTLINMPVSATPTAGDEMSYSFSLDSDVIAKVYAEADGSGGIQNPSFQITGDLTVSGDVTITGNLSVSGNIHTAIKTITSTTSLSVNDANMVVCNSSSDFTITLPTVTTGITYMIKNINTGTVTIDGYSTQLIDDNSSIYIKQWESVTLVSNGTIWLIN